MGEAADTIKGLGYSETAYAKSEAMEKVRSTRQVQGHLEEQKRMTAVREGDAKGLDMFADVLERAMANLRDNYHQSDKITLDMELGMQLYSRSYQRSCSSLSIIDGLRKNR